MSTAVALGQYRVTHVKVPRSTDNGLWAALCHQVGLAHRRHRLAVPPRADRVAQLS